jgi:DNA topoisomerase-3
VAVFCAEECVTEKSEIKIDVGGHEDFILKGTVILEPGWTKYDEFSKQDKILPNLNIGDEVNIRFEPKEKETSPPKHYTIETLNNYLKNPFKTEKAAAQENADTDKIDDTEDYRAIFEGLELGTEATRTGIIDNARKSGYIHLNKDVYTILPGGEYLIETLGRMDICMDKFKTAEMGKALKKVFRGEFTVSDSVEVAKAEIAEVFAVKTVDAGHDSDIGFFRQAVGKCPLCGGDVRRTTFGYGCSEYREKNCKFSIHMSICGRTIPVSAVKSILETGRTEKLCGFVSKKSGRSFDASLKLEEGRVVFDFS